MQQTRPARIRLGACEFDLRAGELRQGEQVLALQEKSVRVLEILIEHGGDIATREEIQRKLWPNDTVVDFDHGINTAIKNLRRALGDSAHQPKYIETIARRGYRLMVPVVRVAAEIRPTPVAGQGGGDGTAIPAELRPAVLRGRTVSHYRVLDIIGGGGMGVVYRAEDLKLGRAVALKFLPEEMGSDPRALERFSREARAASSLDHPNICSIYQFGEHEGRPFIVMQLLQGETLRDRLAAAASDKALPLAQLLDIGIQVCDGLQAAHDKGVIHRDIKPANIFLTDRGVCKILDFGLAKLLEDSNEGEVTEPPEASTAAGPSSSEATHLTLTGMAMGTAGYMSPEQVRGEKLDGRSDLFSLGSVLYEMATGRRAFTGETAAVINDAIVNRAPMPPRELNSELSPHLQAVIDRTLEKDREKRYQTAAEVGGDLTRLKSEADSERASTPHEERHRWPLWLAVSALVLVAALALGWLAWRRLTHPARPSERQLTTNSPGNRVSAGTISPDGKYVAYHDQTGLYLRNIASGETHLVGLPGGLPTGTFFGLYWFPGGGKLLALVSGSEGRELWVVSASGQEEPRLLYRHATDPAISPDGRMVAFVSFSYGSGHIQQNEVWVGNTSGDAPWKLVTTAESQVVSSPTWSPDGQWIAYGRAWKTAQTAWNSAIEVRPAAGGPAKTLLAESGLPKPNALLFVSGVGEVLFSETWSPDWRLVFQVRDTSQSHVKYSLWQIRIAGGTAEPSGKPERLTQWGESDLWKYNLASTTDGKHLSFVTLNKWLEVYVGELGREDASMKAPRSLTRIETGGISSWTHDSQALLFSSVRNGREEIFRQRPNEGIAEKLVAGPRNASGPEMSPDGSWLLYLESDPTQSSATPASFWLMRRPVGGGPAEKVLEVPGAELDEFRCRYNPKASSPCVLGLLEGSDLVFYSLDPIGGKGSRLGKIAIVSPEWMRGWDLSPDGSRVAVVDRHKYGERIEVLTLADGTWHEVAGEPATHTPPPAGQEGTIFYNIAWAADGTSFFVLARTSGSSNLLRVTLEGKVQPLLANESYQNQLLNRPLPSPDGKYVAFMSQTWDGNVWMIDNF